MANKKSDNNKLLGVAAAAAAAIAGAYFLYGKKDAAKNRQKVSGWMLKAKGEVLEQLEDMEEISKKSYNQVVDNVAKGYRGLKNVDRKELSAMVSDMKAHWENIVKQAKKGAQSAPTKAKRTIKKLPPGKPEIKE